jgi:hypothetical protein
LDFQGAVRLSEIQAAQRLDRRALAHSTIRSVLGTVTGALHNPLRIHSGHRAASVRTFGMQNKKIGRGAINNDGVKKSGRANIIGASPDDRAGTDAHRTPSGVEFRKVAQFNL